MKFMAKCGKKRKKNPENNLVFTLINIFAVRNFVSRKRQTKNPHRKAGV